MPSLSTRISRVTAATTVALLVLGASFWCFVLRPARQVRRGLQLAATVQVGQTTGDQVRTMATTYGVRLDEGPNGFGLEQRNRLLEYLHLAPQTVTRVDVRLGNNLVTGISVRAWIGAQGQLANIDIDEFDSHDTGCGDVPVCVKPASSTMLTSVFFVPSTLASEREHLLSLDPRCMSKIGGCKSSREFFPAAWEHEHP
jgi:hypothetical protein